MGSIREAQDNIFLDSNAETNLSVLLNGTMNGTALVDRTNNAYNFSGF